MTPKQILYITPHKAQENIYKYQGVDDLNQLI